MSYEADIGWSDMGQLSALHDWSALPDWLDDKHVELLPVTEEGDDRETGSPSLVTIPPSADLYKHILVALACVRADAGGKVHTEQDFLEEDLSAVLPFDVWEQVIEARKYWRKTTMIQTPGADGQTLLIFVYRCEICRDSAEDANAAVSQNTDRHTLPRSHHTHTRSRGL